MKVPSVTTIGPTHRVWITGGASGIGLEMAERFLARGAQVTVFDRRGDADVQAHLRVVGGGRGQVQLVQLDVADPVATRAAFAQVADTRGAPDLLFHSAGIVSAVEFAKLGDEEWERVVRVNLGGTRNVAFAALPYLEPGARLAMVSSLAGIVGSYGYAAYAASKFGMMGLAEVLRVEWAPQGIAISVICPPEVDTPMVAEERRFRPVATGQLKLFAGSLTVDEAADGILAGLDRGHYLIIPGRKAKLTYWLVRLLPRALQNVVADGIVRRALGLPK